MFLEPFFPFGPSGRIFSHMALVPLTSLAKTSMLDDVVQILVDKSLCDAVHSKHLLKFVEVAHVILFALGQHSSDIPEISDIPDFLAAAQIS